MKPNILESIGAALMAVVGPVHDALLKPKKGQYVSSAQIQSDHKTEQLNAATGEFAPYDASTLMAYIGGTAVVATLVCLLSCGKLGKKKPMRRRRRTTRKRTYRRRK